MKIIYISSACPIDEIDKINNHLKKKMQVSSIKYHNNLINGFLENNINIYSIYGLPISKKICNKIIWKTKKIKKDKCEYIQAGFLNLPILKNISVNITIRKIIKKILQFEKEEIVIIFDGAYISIYPTIKKYSSQLKVFQIVADVYDYMAKVDNKSNYNDLVVKIVRKYVNYCNKKMTGYIFLNKNMGNLYNTNNYVVVEGISTKKNFEKIKNITNKKNIMYAGGLFDKFGVKNLIEAFMKIDNKNYELSLYGYGDLDNYIKEKAKIDKRIQYFGMQDIETVIKAEQCADILINPRPTNLEFQKYSFPSKIIEYMSSGTPVLTTKVEGMPAEYDNYLFYIDDYSIDGLKCKIEDIINLDDNVKDRVGIEAYNFIQNIKSPKKQAEKILNFINSIEEKNEKNM